MDSALLELRDINDNLIDYHGLSIVGPATRYDGVFRVGLLYNHTGYYGGLIDEVKVYNYPMTITGIGDGNNVTPMRYELAQNYPNPFNPTTDIRFVVPNTEKVSLVIYDVLGRQVKTLVNEKMVAGAHKVMWDGT